MLDCFRLLHYHLGSQISNIRDIRKGVMEGARLYCGLVKEGAPMGYLDLGGGLAVDYDGTHTNYVSSRNYSVSEYCTDVVEAVMSILDAEEVAHPHIITESGRACFKRNGRYYYSETEPDESVSSYTVFDTSEHAKQYVRDENFKIDTKHAFDESRLGKIVAAIQRFMSTPLVDLFRED